jgi:hypothetical protein
MSINDSIGNSTIGSTAPAEGTAEPGVSQGVGIDQEQPAKGSSAFATRANKSSSEGLSKGKLLLLGGGLAVAVLFFIITAIAGHAPKKQIAAKPQAQQQKQAETKPAKGSVTPVMDTVRTAAPDNSGGQLGPSDIRRTRASTGQTVPKSIQIPPISLLRQSHEPGEHWPACRRSSRHNRSGKILRLTAKRQTSQPRRTSSKRIEGAIARLCAKRDAEFSRDTFKYERRWRCDAATRSHAWNTDRGEARNADLKRGADAGCGRGRVHLRDRRQNRHTCRRARLWIASTGRSQRAGQREV